MLIMKTQKRHTVTVDQSMGTSTWWHLAHFEHLDACSTDEYAAQRSALEAFEKPVHK